jgi:hypothetical protein
VPPLVGAEVRVMLAFVANLDTEIIVWPQVFNVGNVEYVRGNYETKAGLPSSSTRRSRRPATSPRTSASPRARSPRSDPSTSTPRLVLAGLFRARPPLPEWPAGHFHRETREQEKQWHHSAASRPHP